MISEEIIRSQNFIPRCDFWFAVSALVDTIQIPNTAQMVLRRSPVLCDYINQFDVSQLTDSSIVFCKFDYIEYLLKYLQNHNCNTPFVLLTGQSDYPITDTAYQFVQSYIPVKWWGCNNQSRMANGVPLGIADDFCNLTVKENFQQTKGNRLLYVNHRVETFPSVRKPLYQLFMDKPWATVREPMKKGKTDMYKEELIDHKFMLCPRGNGVDTHRMWEALYSGVIPVVQRSRVHSYLEGKLPILFVDDYKELNESFLVKTYEEYSSCKWNFDILKVSWWIQQMRNTKCQLI